MQARLRKLGVNAVVDYVPADRHCAEPRGRFAPYDPLLLTSVAPSEGRSGYMRLRPDRIKPGQTFLFEVAYHVGRNTRMAVDHSRVADGPVVPCRLLPGGMVVGGVHGEPHS